MEDNSRTAILFRKAEQVDPKEKEKLLDILDSTMIFFQGKIIMDKPNFYRAKLKAYEL